MSTNLDDESSDFINERPIEASDDVYEDDEFDAPIKHEQKLLALD